MRAGNLCFSMIAAVLLFLSTTANSAETVFDGKFWQESSAEVKHMFVHGVMGGVLLGQDRVIRFGLLGKASASLAPECHRAVVGIVNALERQINEWDRNQFVAAMDTFYNDPDNRQLNVKWAVMIVMLEMRGAPKKDIQDYIKHLQNSSP